MDETTLPSGIRYTIRAEQFGDDDEPCTSARLDDFALILSKKDVDVLYTEMLRAEQIKRIQEMPSSEILQQLAPCMKEKP